MALSSPDEILESPGFQSGSKKVTSFFIAGNYSFLADHAMSKIRRSIYFAAMQTASRPASPVTTGYLESFMKNGYCVVDGIYSPQEIAEMERFFDEWRDSPDAFLENRDSLFSKVRLEDIDRTKNLVRAIHPHRFSDRVMGWYTGPGVTAALETLLGKPAFGAQTMYYYKPPGTCGQGMHQDNFYLMAKPATCIAAWTPIDDADEENGCLLVVPGSHRWDMICTGHEGSSWTVNAQGVIGHFPAGHKPQAVSVKRGQTMFFGGGVIHGSGPNRSKDRWRRTFIGHYVDETTESLSRFYHPVVNMSGEVVSTVAEHTGGGPCGDADWQGSAH